MTALPLLPGNFPNAELLQVAFTHTYDSIIVTTPDLESPGPLIIYVNHRFTEMTGWTFDEAVGQTPRILHGPRTDRQVLLRLRDQLAAGESFSGEIINYRKDGSEFFLEWRIEPVYDHNGRIHSWVAVQHDITRFRRAEQTLQEREAEFRAVIESQNDLVCRYQEDGTLTFLNGAYAEFFGQHREALLGCSFFEMFPAEEQLRVRRCHRLLTREEDSTSYESRVVNSNGQQRWLHWNYSLLLDDANRVLGFQTTGRDITDRKTIEQALQQAHLDLEERVRSRTAQLTETNRLLNQEITERKQIEQHLRASEQRFRLLVQGVTDYAIYMVDLHGYVNSWNAGAQRFKGYSSSEVIGKHFSLFYTPEDIALAKPDEALRRAAAEGHFEEQGWRVRKDQSCFFAHVFIDPIYDDNNHLIGYAKITRDITEQRAAEQALIKTMDELLESNASLEQFAYAASHDLKAPLRNIISFLQLLSEECQNHSEDADTYLVFINDNAHRMYALIEDVLEFSRLRADHGTPILVDTQEVFNQALEQLRSAIAEARAEIHTDPLPRVIGYESLLLQLLQNLISNAVKFRQPNEPPRVHIHANEESDHWHFQVCDNGVGIDEDQLQRIFNVFYRLHKTSDYPGTGIGLAICKRIVERHRGTIWAESTHQQGTCFHFTLPRSSASL